MIDALNSPLYNATGPTSFLTLCKASGIAEFFGTAAPGPGWCEYAGLVSGTGAADWVAQNKAALTLIAAADCSPALWTGDNDQALPFEAQSSRYAPGLAMARAPGESFRPADGFAYGSFCHSDITNGGSPRHADAVGAARTRLLDWLFVDAPRVVEQGTLTSLGPVAPDAVLDATVGGACPAGLGAVSLEAVGVCKHPGDDDGDDHPIDPAEFELVPGQACDGSVRWTQRHDAQNAHAASISWKTLAHDASDVSSGLVGRLATQAP